MYTTEPQPDFLDASIVTVLQIHLDEPKGDILVFLCGQDQIEDAVKVGCYFRALAHFERFSCLVCVAVVSCLSCLVLSDGFARAQVLNERGRALPPSADKLLPCPLYAAMPPAQQLLAFNPAPAGTRKVILATNIAESSITIEGILYVVDGGLVKARIYDPKMDMDLLHEVPVSKAQVKTQYLEL